MMYIFCLLAIPQDVASREFRTSTLRHVAATLGIERQISHAEKGTTTQIVLSSGIIVAVRIDSEDMVEHIGLPLFSNEMRQQSPSPVYDCIEYAALDRQIIHTENDLLLKKITFRKGTWRTVANIRSTDACCITTHGNKCYQVVWQREGQGIADIIVPVDYELLSYCNRRELEQSFVRLVAAHRGSKSTIVPKGIDAQQAKVPMSVIVPLSNQARLTVKATISQWVSYCESQGCATSIIFDDSDEENIKGYMLMHNEPMGYHHMLVLNFKTDQQMGTYTKISGKAFLFIPNNEKI